MSEIGQGEGGGPRQGTSRPGKEEASKDGRRGDWRGRGRETGRWSEFGGRQSWKAGECRACCTHRNREGKCSGRLTQYKQTHMDACVCILWPRHVPLMPGTRQDDDDAADPHPAAIGHGTVDPRQEWQRLIPAGLSPALAHTISCPSVPFLRSEGAKGEPEGSHSGTLVAARALSSGRRQFVLGEGGGPSVVTLLPSPPPLSPSSPHPPHALAKSPPPCH